MSEQYVVPAVRLSYAVAAFAGLPSSSWFDQYVEIATAGAAALTAEPVIPET